VAKQGRQELEELWSRERAQRQQQQARRGEGFHADTGSGSDD
jgi:glutathione-regulated potassium-efflux system ancillary protein KefC